MDQQVHPFSTIYVTRFLIFWIGGTFLLSIGLASTLLEDALQIFILTLFGVGVALAALRMMQRRGIQILHLIGRMPLFSDGIAIPLIVPLKIVSLLFLSLIGVIVAAVFQIDTSDVGEPALTTALHVILYGVSSILLGPLVEEFFFRGILFHRLSMRVSIVSAVIISSVLFGMLHLDDFVGATVIGIVLCLLYLRYRTLVVPALVHVSYNGMSGFLGTEWGAEFLSYFVEVVPEWVFLVLGVQALTVVGWCMVALWPRENSRMPYDAAVADKRTSDV